MNSCSLTAVWPLHLHTDLPSPSKEAAMMAWVVTTVPVGAILRAYDAILGYSRPKATPEE